MKQLDVKNIRWFSAPTEGQGAAPVFFYENRIFRSIDSRYSANFLALFESGLIEKLVHLHLMPKTYLSEWSLEDSELLIEQERLPYTIYPQEWTFSMLKQAALCVLNVNKISAGYQYETYDCHGFNVLYHNGWPQFIDVGSFVVKQSNMWSAMDEFIRCYLFPLKCWSDGKAYLAQRILADNHWNRFLPKDTYYQEGFTSFLHQPIDFDELINYVSTFHEKQQSSLWHNYHETYYTATNKLELRFEKILKIVKKLPINTAHDIAGNAGFFTKLLCENTDIHHVLCSDKDVNAINTFFEISVQNPMLKNKVSCILLNVMSPIQNYGNNDIAGRFGSDAVFALALLHHLILTDKTPLHRILHQIKQYALKYVFIEFMPFSHTHRDARTIDPNNSFYTEEWFQKEFEAVFELFHIERLELNRILFCGRIK